MMMMLNKNWNQSNLFNIQRFLDQFWQEEHTKTSFRQFSLEQDFWNTEKMGIFNFLMVQLLIHISDDVSNK